MYNALYNESNSKYDLIIHSSAVGDYRPEFSFRMEDMAEEIALAIKNGMVTKEEILRILNSEK